MKDSTKIQPPPERPGNRLSKAYSFGNHEQNPEQNPDLTEYTQSYSLNRHSKSDPSKIMGAFVLGRLCPGAPLSWGAFVLGRLCPAEAPGIRNRRGVSISLFQGGVGLRLGNITFTPPIEPVHLLPFYPAVYLLPVILGGLVLLWRRGGLALPGRIYYSLCRVPGAHGGLPGLLGLLLRL